MSEAVEVYAATLQEVRRQAAHLRRLASGGAGAVGGGSTGSGTSTPASNDTNSSSSSGGWVVLESASTPAALPSEAGGCSVWPQAQWQVAYELLFCQCPPAVARLRPHGTDDLLFFVYTEEAAAAARTRLFVRRRQTKAAALPADLSAPPTAAAGAGGGPTAGRGVGPGLGAASKAALVDWRASVLLMVVLQTAFRLSVVTSDDPELLNSVLEDPDEKEEGGQWGQRGQGQAAAAGQEAGPRGAGTAGAGSGSDRRASGSSGGGGGSSESRLRRVTKTVHASPSHVPVNLDQSRSEAGPQASYPDICFAVDSCDEAFQSQVLRRPGDCYCVVLHADVAQSWSLPASQAASAAAPETGTAAAAAAAAADMAASGLAALSLSGQQQQQQQGGGEVGLQSSEASVSSNSNNNSNSSSAESMSSAVSRQQQHKQQGTARAASAAAAPAAAVVVFSGYVSHLQLTTALGGQLAGDPLRKVLRAAAAATRGESSAAAQSLATCRVSMRGPGGVGAADVAVSSYAPSTSADLAAGRAAAAGAPPAAAPSAGSAEGPAGGPAAGRVGRPNLFARAQLLARGVAAAAKQAAAGPGAGGGSDVPIEQLHLRCALMALQVPVGTLAAAILEVL